MEMTQGPIEGNLDLWKQFWNQKVGSGFYKPALDNPDPKWPKYCKTIGKRPSAYLKVRKVEREIDLFEFQFKIHRRGDDFGQVERKLPAAVLAVLADVPHRTENPNFAEHARRFGAQWGFPGIGLRLDDMVILGNPSTGRASDEVFYFRIFPEFPVDMNRLIRFGRVDRESATERVA